MTDLLLACGLATLAGEGIRLAGAVVLGALLGAVGMWGWRRKRRAKEG
jgi:hypothetical protein